MLRSTGIRKLADTESRSQTTSGISPARQNSCEMKTFSYNLISSKPTAKPKCLINNSHFYMCSNTDEMCFSFTPGVLTDQLCVIDFFLFLHLTDIQQKGPQCVLNNFLLIHQAHLPHPKTYDRVCVWKMALLFLDVVHSYSMSHLVWSTATLETISTAVFIKTMHTYSKYVHVCVWVYN